MNVRLASVCVLLGVVMTLPAQGGDVERAAAELARVKRDLEQNRGEVDRLLDMRLRHDLGLPVEEDASQFRSAAPATTEAMERARQELRDQDAQNAILLARFQTLRAQVEQLRSDAAARASAEHEQGEGVVVPQAGTAQPARPRALPDEPAPDRAVAQQAAEAGPSAGVPPTGVLLDIGPIQATIHGSADHQQVAQALFKAGQALTDRAAALREQGQAAVADQLDARAKERLLRAVEELAPLLQQKEPPFVSLFYLGRCRELLFRLAERHEGLSLGKSVAEFQQREDEVQKPFLLISTRDVMRKGERGEIEVLGPWGLAAQTAREHFRWMNLHSGYRPSVAIETLTWPGEHDQ